MLKFQNQALSVRLDVLKKDYDAQKKQLDQNHDQLANNKTIFSHFFGAWKAFLYKLEGIHQTAKVAGDSEKFA